jgi:hypothetical protein
MNVEALFHNGDLSATLENQLSKAQRAVDEPSDTEFREAGPAVVAERIINRYRVEPITITEGAISVQAEDADIQRRPIPDLDWGFPGDSPTVRGTRVTYNVPFTGEEILFRLKPPRWTTVLPRAELAQSELRFHYEVQSSQVAGTKASFDRDLGLLKEYVGWVNEEVHKFGAKLIGAVEQSVNARVARLNAAAEGLSQLGLPVRNLVTVKLDAHIVTPPKPSTSQAGTRRTQYDVALSFAGEDRAYVQEVAKALAAADANVFFDEFERIALWGKDLVEHLQDIYQNQARFCVLFISKHYIAKPWPTHERRSAQARALVAREEYLLPARFDDSVVPGLQPTVGYVDLRSLAPDALADLILQKIGLK